MCAICIADGRIDVPALRHCCSWRRPRVLGCAPHYTIAADYAAGTMVAGGVSIWERVYSCRNHQFLSQVWAEEVALLSWTTKIDADTKKLMWSSESAPGCCSGLLAPRRGQSSLAGGGLGLGALPPTCSALSVGAMKTMNGESSAVRTIFRVCGERGVVIRVWPFLRVGASAAGWLLSPTTPCCPPARV